MSDFTTIRVGQLAPEVWSGTDNLPHEVGTDLKRGTVADLATYIASVIDASAGLAFNPLKITDGQTLPETTINEWIIVGKGTYLQVGGVNITCIDDINIITSNGSSWSLGFGFNLDVPNNISERFLLNTPNTVLAVGGIPVNEVLADRTPIDLLIQMLTHPSKTPPIPVEDEFYFDENNLLRLNVSTYRQVEIATQNNQTFTLDFEPTFIISVIKDGIYLLQNQYIYTTPNQLQVLANVIGETIEITYEKFINEPTVL